MSDILKDGTGEALIEYWKRVRADIGKFDRIIVNNYVQHMTLLVGLITLSTYLYLGNPELTIFCCVINFCALVLTVAFRGQNSLYQKLIKKNIDFAVKVETILFKKDYMLTNVLASSLSLRDQKHMYTYSYIIIGIVALGIALWFLALRFFPDLL